MDQLFPDESWYVYLDGECFRRVGMDMETLRLPENASIFHKCIDLILIADLVAKWKRPLPKY